MTPLSLLKRNVDPETKRETSRPLLLQNKILMTGDMIKDAQVRIGGNFNEPYVSLEMTGNGARLFGNVTEKMSGRDWQSSWMV